LELLATTVTGIVAALLIWRAMVPTGGEPTARRTIDISQAAPISIEEGLTRGDLSARAVIIEYSDFLCPYCGKFAREMMPQLLRTYIDGGRALISFKHLPIAAHAGALTAAEGAQCAAEQGKFWQMHDLMFRNQPSLSEANGILDLARAAGVDLNSWSHCLNDERTRIQVEEDANSARALKITGTPSFIFGYRMSDGKVRPVSGFAGAKSIDDFNVALNRLLDSDGAR